MKKEILDIISRNSRYSTEDLAAMTGADKETVEREIKEMEDDKIICGHTSATINCDTLERHEIFLLHGAKAFINASGWAVVSVKGATGCQQIRNVSGNAVIL